MVETLLGHHALVRVGEGSVVLDFAIEEVRHVAHHGGVERRRQLEHGEAAFERLSVVRPLHVVLGRVPDLGLMVVEGAIGAHLVAHLAAEQAVDRHACRLAGDVPERHLDGAHRRAPRLEAATHADAPHDPLDVDRVLPDDPRLELQYDRLEVRLGRLDLTPAGDALVRRDADHRCAGDDSAFHVRDLQGFFLRLSYSRRTKPRHGGRFGVNPKGFRLGGPYRAKRGGAEPPLRREALDPR